MVRFQIVGDRPEGKEPRFNELVDQLAKLCGAVEVTSHGRKATVNGVPYGYCPLCNAPGKSRERRPNGNDECEEGHVYPSSASCPTQTDTVFIHKGKVPRPGNPPS